MQTLICKKKNFQKQIIFLSFKFVISFYIIIMIQSSNKSYM